MKRLSLLLAVFGLFIAAGVGVANSYDIAKPLPLEFALSVDAPQEFVAPAVDAVFVDRAVEFVMLDSNHTLLTRDIAGFKSDDHDVGWYALHSSFKFTPTLSSSVEKQLFDPDIRYTTNVKENLQLAPIGPMRC